MDDAAFLSYPPYYTRQPREDTWRKQCDLWCRALVTAVRARASPMVDIASEDIFTNARINRAVDVAMRREIIDALERRREASWTSPTTACVVDAATVRALCDAMRDVVEKYGLSGKVLTLSELTDARGIAKGTALAGEDEQRCAFAARAFELEGACATFELDGATGVKFA